MCDFRHWSIKHLHICQSWVCLKRYILSILNSMILKCILFAICIHILSPYDLRTSFQSIDFRLNDNIKFVFFAIICAANIYCNVWSMRIVMVLHANGTVQNISHICTDRIDTTQSKNVSVSIDFIISHAYLQFLKAIV